ncbi:MAG: GTPase Era [Candidatus Omnitrophica bacterium]|nr:GTPase Era [Candidatus Omnitrophota bacterium]
MSPIRPAASHHDAPSFRSGFIGIIGKPNVGKSTILNAFLDRKVSITSPRPQTTRHRILGILTRPDVQAIFIDSPGWHKPQHPLGQYMVTVARGVVEEANVLLVVIAADSRIEREDEWVFDQARRAKRPAILAVNKVDAVSKPLVLPLIERCAALKLFEDYVPVSARTGENLPVLLNELVKRLPAGPRWYEEEHVTDQTSEQLIREFIREAALYATQQEVPHALAVQLDEVTPKERLTVIRATILVERAGQKAIVIGRQGQMLKRIGQQARLELERWLGRKVFLELWVKVAEDWRRKPSMLRDLGYHS